MKKNFKKLSSLALAFLLVFSLSAQAFAADLSAEQAKNVALKDAGYKQSQVSALYAGLEYDDGLKYYDVSFRVAQSDGSYFEYDYDVRVSDGKILEKDVERERGYGSSAQAQQSAKPAQVQAKAAENKNVDEAQAKKAALAHFGVKEADVKFVKASREYDDGVLVYEFEFCKPYSVKYSCDVVASSGKVRDAEQEAVRGLGDKLELFFGVLFYNLLNK